MLRDLQSSEKINLKLFNRHHVRASFYHFISLIFVITTVLWLLGIVSDKMSFIITAILFVSDYLAEMYDPHPENPGLWFKSHFHRMFDSEDNDEHPCKVTKAVKRADKKVNKIL